MKLYFKSLTDKRIQLKKMVLLLSIRENFS